MVCRVSLIIKDWGSRSPAHTPQRKLSGSMKIPDSFQIMDMHWVMEDIMKFTNDWVLKPEFFPAWLQAFSAIVAICISVASLFRTDALARKRDRLERQGIVVAIYPDILKLDLMARKTREAIENFKEGSGHLHGQNIGHMFESTALISMPSSIERNLDRLFVIGPVAGPSCIQLYALIMQYNSLVGSMSARLMVMNREDWPTAISYLDEHIKLLRIAINKCERKLRPIHDNIERTPRHLFSWRH